MSVFVCSNTTLLKLQTVLFLFLSKFCTSKSGVRLIYGCGLHTNVYGNFYHTVVYLFHTSEPSRKNGLKLKPRGHHTATTRKVVSVRFPVRGHKYVNAWGQVKLRISAIGFSYACKNCQTLQILKTQAIDIFLT